MMSDIKVVYPTASKGGAINAADAKQMSDVFVDMVKGLATEVDGDWSIASELVTNRGTDDALMINIVNNKAGITIKRNILYNASDKSYNIAHDLFQMNSGLQNSGIANKVNAATVNLANKFPFKTAFLEANLDVGGYAWLRKGAWPDGGLDALIDIANLKKEFGNKREVSLAEGLLRSLNNLTEAQARVYVMQPRFSIYKDIFLGSDWTGDFRLSDPLVKAAMQGDEYTKTKLIIDRIKETKLPIDKIDLTNLEAKLASLKPLIETPTVKPFIRPTSNKQILDEYIKHQTYLMRFAEGLGDELGTLLSKSDDKLNDTLLKWLAKVEDRSLASTGGRSWQKEFESAISANQAPAWDAIQQQSQKQLEKLAITEAAVGASIIQGAIPVVLGLSLPSAAHLTSIVRSQPLEGRVLKDWLAKSQQANVDSIVTSAKAGIIQGQTPAHITRTIMGSQSADYADGMARRKAQREIKSLVRTIVNGVQTEAKQALYEANSDIIKNELFVATLDGRTTFVCAGNDGQTFPRGEGPMTPLHFGCRSLRVPYINADNLGDRPFNPTTEKGLLKEYSEQSGIDVVTKRDKLPRGHKTKYDEFARKRKRELIGQTPAKTSYSDWLKGQSKEFQDEYLGPARAELFRTGQIKLDKFSANDGSTLTLDQLVEKSALPKASTKKVTTGVSDGSVISSEIRTGENIAAKYNKAEAAKHVELNDITVLDIAKLTPDNRKALTDYVEEPGVFEELNGSLRDGKVLSPALLKTKQELDKALGQFTVPVDRLYRGDSSLPATAAEAKQLIGKTLTNNGYTSTSIAPRTASLFGNRSGEIGQGLIPDDAYPVTVLEFNTEGRNPLGLYVTANDTSSNAMKVYDTAKEKGVINNEFFETEVLIGSGKRYKIVGIREELMYNEMLEGDELSLIYEAIFLD